MNPNNRQIFQSGMAIVITFMQAFFVSLYAIGSFPTNEQLYLAGLGSAISAIGVAAALFGVSKIQIGGIENEQKIVQALHTDAKTLELDPKVTAAMLAKPAPESLK